MKIQIDTKKIIKKIKIKSLNSFFLMILTGIAIALMTVYLLVPMTIYILNQFLQIVTLYSLLEDKNFIFLGAIFFLIVAWEIFNGLCSILISFIDNFSEFRKGAFKC